MSKRSDPNELSPTQIKEIKAMAAAGYSHISIASRYKLTVDQVSELTKGFGKYAK